MADLQVGGHGPRDHREGDMILGSTDQGIARRRGDRVELLDLPHSDLSAALEAGMHASELERASVRVTVAEDEVQLRAPVPRPRNVWAVGLAYRDHAEEAASHVQLEETELPALFLKASSSVIGPT